MASPKSIDANGSPAPGFDPAPGFALARDDVVAVAGGEYRRVLVRTPWLTPEDDLAATLRAGLGGLAAPGDTVFVAEKVAVLLTGRAVPSSTVRVGRLARYLAARTRPIGNSRALSIPEKMQYVVDHVGTPRILLASAAAAATRPLGRTGTFFRVAGPIARDLDGMRTPYHEVLLPPLPVAVAGALVTDLAAQLGTAVAVVDVNDRGGSIRAVSDGGLDPATLLAVLRDNPLGHCDNATPIGLIRPR